MWRDPAGPTAKRPRTVATVRRGALRITVLGAGVATDPPRYRALLTDRDGRTVQTVDIAAHNWARALNHALAAQNGQRRKGGSQR